jgi:predicted dehydrogenase
MRSDAPLRAGILGTGWMLGKYVQVFRLLNDATLVAVASHTPERAAAVAVDFKIPRAHDSYEALVRDEEIDIVINALHNGLHCEWSINALETGKHVLCEKPLGCSSAEVDRMFAAAHRCQRWLMEGFMYRFHPQIPEVLRHVRAGEIGRLIHVRSSRAAHGRERDNPRFWQHAGGGALLDLGCYCVDFSRLVFGSEPHRVDATSHFDSETGVDLTTAGTMEFTGDGIAQFVCSFEAEPGYAAEVLGTDGKILIPHPWSPPAWPVEFFITRAGKTEIIRVNAPENLETPVTPYALQLQHFCDCIRRGFSPIFPPDTDAEQDSCGNMRVLDALAASARR